VCFLGTCWTVARYWRLGWEGDFDVVALPSFTKLIVPAMQVRVIEAEGWRCMCTLAPPVKLNGKTAVSGGRRATCGLRYDTSLTVLRSVGGLERTSRLVSPDARERRLRMYAKNAQASLRVPR
jgi:hypothetical protein